MLIMKNKIIFSSITVIVVALCSVIYYYFHVLVPEQVQKRVEQEKEDFLKLSIQCKKDGEKKLEDDIKIATSLRSDNDVIDCFYQEPKYVFNKEMNTCLYYGGYTCDLKKIHSDGVLKGLSVTRWQKHVVDVYTNKTLKEIYIDDSSDVSDWKFKEIEAFDSESDQLGF
jgi:uncharacterized protein (DUF4415 family)